MVLHHVSFDRCSVNSAAPVQQNIVIRCLMNSLKNLHIHEKKDTKWMKCCSEWGVTFCECWRHLSTEIDSLWLAVITSASLCVFFSLSLSLRRNWTGSGSCWGVNSSLSLRMRAVLIWREDTVTEKEERKSWNVKRNVKKCETLRDRIK